MTPDKKILLDVGGTFIKCSDGRSVPVDSNASREDIIASFREAVGPVSDDVQLRAAMPGPFDYAMGQFLMKHKYAALYGEFFADIVGLPRDNCRFIHDVNCMLLGEKPQGNTAIIALGTGLGFAMFVDGDILKSDLGSPKVSIYNRPFGDGILEDYASKRGLLNLYGHLDLSVKDVAGRAFSGEQEAVEAFAKMGEIIGETIAPIMAEYKIETLLLGGQICRSAKLFSRQIIERLPDTVKTVRTISDFDNATFRGLEDL